MTWRGEFDLTQNLTEIQGVPIEFLVVSIFFNFLI